MRIGFDVTPITVNRTGVGNYCFYLLKHLVSMMKEESISCFSAGRGGSGLSDLGLELPHHHTAIPTRALYKLWSLFNAPKVDKMLGGVDVYHATNFFLPAVESARRIVTIHDLTFLVAPHLCSPKILAPFSKGIKRFAQSADAIVTYSEWTRSDMATFLDVEPEKVTVTPLAVDEGLHPIPKDEAASHIAEKYDIKTPYLLFVSTLEPRKNVPGLIRAFAKIAKDLPHNLVLIGGLGWDCEIIFQTIEEFGLSERVHHMGFLNPHSELAAFYSAADAFVFPSFYEGFGLPILEAMACGCPVVSSTNASLPEVAGECAVYCDAEDDSSIVNAVYKILQDETATNEMVAKGLERSKEFSWESCAKLTLDLYERLA